MHIPGSSLRLALLGAVAILAGACSHTSGGGSATASCAVVAPEALSSCVESYGAAIGDCYLANGAPCGPGDAGANAALGDLESTVRAKCADGAYGGLSSDALVGRLRNACASEASSTSNVAA